MFSAQCSVKLLHSVCCKIRKRGTWRSWQAMIRITLASGLKHIQSRCIAVNRATVFLLWTAIPVSWKAFSIKSSVVILLSAKQVFRADDDEGWCAVIRLQRRAETSNCSQACALPIALRLIDVFLPYRRTDRCSPAPKQALHAVSVKRSFVLSSQMRQSSSIPWQ